MKKGLNLLKTTVLLGCVLAFVSCMQAPAEISRSEGTVVFEYEDAESFPQARLAVFTETVSDPRRTESVEVLCTSNGFQWISDRVAVYETMEHSYAGVSNLFMPENKPFTGGEYQVVYRTLSNDNDSGSFYLSPHYDVYSMTVQEVETYMMERNGYKKIIMFDGENRVLYYGDATDYIDPFDSFRDCVYYRYLWKGNGLMCLLPSVKR